MATFPNVKFGWRDSGETPTSPVARSEMERGPAKQRRAQADVIVTIPLTVYFDTVAEATAFETWVYTTINGGADWFDFTLPRTGTVVNARIIGGDIGTLRPTTKNWAYAERSFKLEYVRSAL